MQIFLSIDPFLDKPKPSAMPDWDARRRFGVFFVGVSGLLWPVLGIIRILRIVAFFAYRWLQMLPETVKSHPIQGMVRRLPHGRRDGYRASQAAIAVGDSCVSLPLFTCDRATTSML